MDSSLGKRLLNLRRGRSLNSNPDIYKWELFQTGDQRSLAHLKREKKLEWSSANWAGRRIEIAENIIAGIWRKEVCYLEIIRKSSQNINVSSTFLFFTLFIPIASTPIQL